MRIDFNVLARVAKLVALFGFFLPWVAVSCSGTEIATGTGWQWMTGHLEPAGPLASMQDQAQSSADDQKPGYFVIAAFAVIALALLVSLLTRRRAAAAVLMAGALVGAGLSFYNFEYVRSEMNREANRQHRGDIHSGDVVIDTRSQVQLQQAVANAIEVEKKEGFWVTIGALAVAALFALLTLANIRVVRDETAPPANTG